MKALWALPMLCLLLACNGEVKMSESRKDSGDKNPTSEKTLSSESSDATINDELDAFPPELIGGTYLTDLRCGKVATPASANIPNDKALTGCAFYRQDNSQIVKIGTVIKKWNLVSAGVHIKAQELELPKDAKLVGAFLVGQDQFNKGIDFNLEMQDRSGKTLSYSNNGDEQLRNNNGDVTVIINGQSNIVVNN